eukprot:m.463587 g.463587  ORF g.463587 m.463587 type:complete len:392 (-) comp23096_c0_seq1:55-1230(-)
MAPSFVAASTLVLDGAERVEANNKRGCVTVAASVGSSGSSQLPQQPPTQHTQQLHPLSAAAAAVLTPHTHADELLVRVLVYLTLPELTRARLVCSRWRTAADSNFIWRRICCARCPSALTEPVRRVILAGGGYRAYYLATARRPRSVLADFVFTIDVTATSYVGLPYTEAIGGTSFGGSSVVPAADELDEPEARRFIMPLRKPWRFTTSPYSFKTLGDLVDKVTQETVEGAKAGPQLSCHPELRLQIGAVHRSELKNAQIATLSEGRDLRTTGWYRDRGAAALPETHEAAAPPSPRRKGPGGRRSEAVELDFSGSVAFPTHLGGVDRQVLDVTLRGTVTEMTNATRIYDISTVVFGPLFNLNDGPAAATAADFAECLDLKLGLHTEDNMLF